MNSLINVSEGYIPNLGSLRPLLHVEKFVDGGGWWKTKVSVHLSPKLNNIYLLKMTVRIVDIISLVLVREYVHY